MRKNACDGSQSEYRHYFQALVSEERKSLITRPPNLGLIPRKVSGERPEPNYKLKDRLLCSLGGGTESGYVSKGDSVG